MGNDDSSNVLYVNEPSGIVSILNSSFVNNSANYDSVVLGVLQHSGSVSILHSSFVENSASEGVVLGVAQPSGSVFRAWICKYKA